MLCVALVLLFARISFDNILISSEIFHVVMRKVNVKEN